MPAHAARSRHPSFSRNAVSALVKKPLFVFGGLGHPIERGHLAYFVPVRIVHCILFKLK